MNWIDSIIAALNPAAGLARARARAALGEVRAYDGASRGRRMAGWKASTTGPVSEVRAARVVLRDRSRDLVRNNAWGRRAVTLHVSSLVGTGIRPRPTGTDARLNKKITALWDAWCAECDHNGRLDFYGLQALAARTDAESGEVLAMMVPEGANSKRAVPLKLQLLEPDWLADFTQVPLLYTDAEAEGILFNNDGTRRGYKLWNRNINENYAWSVAATGTREVSADDMVHLYQLDRPGQLRGIPRLASVMRPLRDLDDYHDAALMLAKIQSILGVFIEQQGGPAGSPMGQASRDDAGDLETLAPGMIGYLRPGESAKFLSPTANAPFNDYTRTFLHMVAAGFGLTYHQLTGDLRDANYSSLRAGNLEFRRLIEQQQRLHFIPTFCVPIWKRFIRQAIIAGKLPDRAADVPVIWTPPRFDLVDPGKDTAAIIAAVRAGLMTMQEAIAEMGYDPTTQVEQIAAFYKLVDEAGVILDTDPRRVDGRGQLIDATAEPNSKQVAPDPAATDPAAPIPPKE